MTFSEITQKLQSIHLTNSFECRKEVDFLIKLIFCRLPWLHHPIKKGTIISRCRKDAPNLEKESFGSPPSEKIIDIQRASIEHESVFYGSVGDNSIEDGDFIAMLEASQLHRSQLSYGEEDISVSHWVVVKDIDMALICHPNVYVEAIPNGMVNEMQKNYLRILPNYPIKELVTEFDHFVEFIASQFAKIVKEENREQYLISALFSHYALLENENEPNENGLIYPSTQTNGRLGYNVALRPNVEKENLCFIEAKRHTLCKINNEYLDKTF